MYCDGASCRKVYHPECFAAEEKKQSNSSDDHRFCTMCRMRYEKRSKVLFLLLFFSNLVNIHLLCKQQREGSFFVRWRAKPTNRKHVRSKDKTPPEVPPIKKARIPVAKEYREEESEAEVEIKDSPRSEESAGMSDSGSQEEDVSESKTQLQKIEKEKLLIEEKKQLEKERALEKAKELEEKRKGVEEKQKKLDEAEKKAQLRKVI